MIRKVNCWFALMKNKMMTPEEAIRISNNTIEVFANPEKFIVTNLVKGSLAFSCGCGANIRINGVSSHSKVCSQVLNSRKEFINSILPENCFTCTGLIIREDYNIVAMRQQKYSCFCSESCSKKAKIAQVYKERIIKCLICSDEFVKTASRGKLCSRLCAIVHSKENVKEWHKNNRDTELYKERNEKIRKNTGFKKITSAWNKGLSGAEYLDHYEKNGENTLYSALAKNNGYFRGTSIEGKMKALLEKLNFKFRHGFFYKKHQFDFYIEVDDKRRLIIECDGDYWHKSSRRCKNVQDQSQARNRDTKKEEYLKSEFSKENRIIEVVRFWELNINKNMDIIEQFILNLKNLECYEKGIKEIKEYYLQNS